MNLTSKSLLTLAVSLLTLSSHVVADDAAYGDGLFAKLDTAKGEIVLQLEFEKCPLTVCNFVGLVEGTKDSNKGEGVRFYDGLVFHRVIADFMIQGGCPDGNGRGGPGYRFADEIDPSLKHTGPGILSMANAGPATNGSQFFITHKATPWLDGKHTVFGHVVKGQDVVNAIEKGDSLKSVTIIRNGEKAAAFKADQAAFEDNKKGLAKRMAELAEKNKSEITKRIEKEGITTASGLKYIVTDKGTGTEKPTKGTNVQAHYTGTLTDGKKFDSSRDKGRTFNFPVGEGRVIKGWDEAFLDMVKGEKRLLLIPPDLAYGSRGAGGVIPPNASLVFDVELVDF